MLFTTAHSGIGPPTYSSLRNWHPISTGMQKGFSNVMKDHLYVYSTNRGPQMPFGTPKYASDSMQYLGSSPTSSYCSRKSLPVQIPSALSCMQTKLVYQVSGQHKDIQ